MARTIDPCSQIFTAGLEMARTGLRFGEMMRAANSVIGTRCRTITAAAQNPIEADYAELGRMVSEKVDAFSKAGRAVANEWWEMQSDVVSHLRHIGALMLAGRAPTPAELVGLTSHTTDHATSMVTRSMRVGGVALAPVHARATANARRLERKNKRRS